MKNLKQFAWMVAGAAVLSGSAFAGAYEIGEAMGEESFWKSDPVIFVHKHQDAGFKFTSQGREAADSRREGGVAYFGIPAYETRLGFGEGGGITRVELTLFNRGGTENLEVIGGGEQKVLQLKRVDKKMTEEDFRKVVQEVSARLTPTGKKVPKSSVQRMKNTDIRQYERTWKEGGRTGPECVATLTWNFEQDNKKTKFEPGFIRLTVERAVGKGAERKASAGAGKRGGSKLTENVARESRGDVYIHNVPMVDQGQKGYCAAAAAERVLRYYGLDVDEHEIAVAAKTHAAGGTTTGDMIQTVRTIGQKNSLATDVLYGDADRSDEERIANLEKEVRQYNKAAKKLKKPQITDDVYITRSGNAVMYSPAAVDAAKDTEVLKELKVNGVEKPKYQKFMKDIRRNIDAGMPLLWGVTLGMYPEADLPQTQGGHMRLIIGYNDKKAEILYSDSWGQGHELKRMPSEWAWTITHSLLGLRPLK